MQGKVHLQKQISLFHFFFVCIPGNISQIAILLFILRIVLSCNLFTIPTFYMILIDLSSSGGWTGLSLRPSNALVRRPQQHLADCHGEWWPPDLSPPPSKTFAVLLPGQWILTFFMTSLTSPVAPPSISKVHFYTRNIKSNTGHFHSAHWRYVLHFQFFQDIICWALYLKWRLLISMMTFHPVKSSLPCLFHPTVPHW